MTELMAGMVAVVVLLAGLIQLISLTRAETDVMNEARAEAGRDAMNSVYSDGNANYIRDWEKAADEKAYTRDDEFTDGDTARFRSVVVARAGNSQSDWDTLNSVPNNRISALGAGQDPARAFGLVRGYESETIQLLPATRSLIYRADEIELESEVYMTWTTGIY